MTAEPTSAMLDVRDVQPMLCARHGVSSLAAGEILRDLGRSLGPDHYQVARHPGYGPDIRVSHELRDALDSLLGGLREALTEAVADITTGSARELRRPHDVTERLQEVEQ